MNPAMDSELTIPGVLARAARQFGTDTAIEDGTLRLSFEGLEAACLDAAAGFIALGIGHGDRVGIWAPNRAEWIIAAIGAQTVGAAIIPLNTRLKGREAGDILRRGRARLLFTVEGFLGARYPELLAGEDLPALERIVLFDDGAAVGAGIGPGATATSGIRAADDGRVGVSWERFLAGGRGVPREEVLRLRSELRGDDLADVMFTSGTTGQPKGVMCAHEQNVRAFTAWSEFVGLQRGDRYLIVNPFFHAFGYKAGWQACLITGARISPVAVLDAGAALARIERERITVLPGPPTLFQTLLAHEALSRYDLSSLRLAVTGAATVPPSLIEKMHTVLGFETVVTGYGLTESMGIVTMCRPGDSIERIALTCGVPIPGVEVRCADDGGRSVPRGEPGEVLVRGYNVMRGYLDDPVATAEAIDPDGWLHTGDIGVLDAEGYLRITDRRKDMFIVGGFNCYPAEIEKIMAAHPDIAQVAVISAPDERLGEVGHAYVIRRAGSTLDEAALIAWCRDNMANYKVPRRIEFVASLPTNAAGKVQKFALRDGLRA
jgi:acyl-CoA synthetase (AMP-forming)/AMP-acid ligase II